MPTFPDLSGLGVSELPTSAIFELNIFFSKHHFIDYLQSMGCEGARVYAHVRFAVAHVRVRAKSILKCVCDVRACGLFGRLRCDRTFAHFLHSF